MSTQLAPLSKVPGFPKNTTLSPLPRNSSADSVYRDGSRSLRRKTSSVPTLLKAASERSTKTSNAGPENRSPALSNSTITPDPEINNLSPIPLNDMRTSAALVFHLVRSLNPSSDERIFLLTSLHGIRTAIFLAAIHRWTIRRPLLEFLAMMSESGKNYSALSAKRKRRSGSPASSRKRSSGACSNSATTGQSLTLL